MGVGDPAGGPVQLPMAMFPLGTVLFPFARLPLHVFEPRYRVLVHDCLRNRNEFGVVLIERGHEVGGGDDRFRIGGVNSVRGYSENAISPVGGLVMVLANAELRVPLIGPFGIEAFVDGGNVWSRPAYLKVGNFVPRVSRDPRDPGDMRYVLGAGGRLNLPFGPLRVDFTWNVQPDRNGGLRRWLVAEPQFAIGPAF